MLSEDRRRFLTDIVTNIRLAFDFAGDLTADELRREIKTFYAVVRCLEIISEASLRLDPEVFERHPSIAWRDMRAAGNIYRHEYGQVDPDLVAHTVRLELPPLLAAVEAELARAD